MSLNLNKQPKTYKAGPKQPTLEAGTYPGRVVQLIDLGLQPQQPYMGQEKAPRYEMMATYELVDVFMVDEAGNEDEDKPRWISETFGLNPLDNDRATSTKRYHALDPAGDANGDFTALIGQPCNVTVTINVGKGKNAGKLYENISAVTAVRARDLAKFPELKNESKVFTLDEPDVEVFNKLPQWIQDKIKGNLGYEGSALQKALGGSQSPAKGKGATTPKGSPRKSVEVNEDIDYEGEMEKGRDFEEGEPW